MRWSRFYIPTLKEAPGDAEIISHKLLIRAGMIRKLTSGIYTWLPLGLRTLNKAANIVRKEMDAAGAQEILMPTVQPGDLWRESGRWEQYGRELLRFVDRHDREYCLGPTHEEVVTDLVRGEVCSYRQLPVNLYQIQGKFRDEIRPRFGLMRGREFLMKDGYSFDRDDAGANESYKSMFEAYVRIFSRMSLRFRSVEADSGSIGGSSSHEFMVLADTGEDVIAFCNDCDWSANIERAAVLPKPFDGAIPSGQPERVHTPDIHTMEALALFMKLPTTALLKTLLYAVDGQPVAVMVRGDRDVNEIKLKNSLNAITVELATPEQVVAWTGAPVGFAGPVGLAKVCPDIRLLADHELQGSTWVVGANENDAHLQNVHLVRDVADVSFVDLRSITEEDPCPVCHGRVSLTRGIEVGHVFKLGTKYSQAMNATFLDDKGKEQVMVMGCYGIGVSRVVAACIEQNNDGDGIVFPPPLAPFEVLLLNLDPKDAQVSQAANEIYTCLQAKGLDVLLDDREERPGVKFKDADLIGIPMQIVLGGKSLAKGVVEVKNRKTGEKTTLSIANFAEEYAAWQEKVYQSWN